jgi:hypothetical protein
MCNNHSEPSDYVWEKIDPAWQAAVDEFDRIYSDRSEFKRRVFLL